MEADRYQVVETFLHNLDQFLLEYGTQILVRNHNRTNQSTIRNKPHLEIVGQQEEFRYANQANILHQFSSEHNSSTVIRFVKVCCT